MSPYNNILNDDPDNEEETKTNYIDPALREVGWITQGDVRLRKEYIITKGRLIGNGERAKPLKADYVLQYKRRGLAVIEAKAIDKYYTEGVSQAIEYAKRLNIRFAYATNGKQIYEIDMETGIEQDVDRYPTPEELWKKTYSEQLNAKAEQWLNKFYQIPFNDKSGTWQPRYYQENAINEVLKAIANGKDRVLLTLATGTGKTAISFQIVNKLLETKWTKNGEGHTPKILFLADRNTLADQAFNAYSAIKDENALKRINPDQIRKDGQVPKNGSVFFTIFQTFMSGEKDTPYFGQYPKDFFDLVIVDECHRGGANDESKWRAILEYFSPAVQLGMTATPKRNENADTYKYFGEPVYIYSLKQAIDDGFLTPFRVESITTTGDIYKYHEDDEILEGTIDPTREYGIKEQNRIIEIKANEQKKVEVLMERLNQNQKTLVFCASQNHAALIRDLIKQKAKNKDPEYCCRVTANDGDIGDQHLKAFKNNERTIPTILTTSQKLSTGVDAPEVRNIVILRDIQSEIEFKQILGRGTRLYDGKDYFTIYDFAGVHTKFIKPDWDGEPLPPEPKRPVGGKYLGEPKTPYHRDPIIRVKLSEKRRMELQAEVETKFYNPAKELISAEEFIKQLYGDIPTFFNSEAELRAIWKDPTTRTALLQRLTNKGYGRENLHELSKLINGDTSDIFDVLTYIAYNKKPLMRSERADLAKERFTDYSAKQQEFLNFVLEQYINEGVQELDPSKLPDLLKLKYHDASDGIKTLGITAPLIREMFINFQSHLYSEA